MRPTKVGGLWVDMDDIESRIDLTQYFGESLLCPWHSETQPSLHVYPDHVHCFGCGKHMGAIQFLQYKWELPKVKVIKRLLGELPASPPMKEKAQIPDNEEVRSYMRALALLPEHSFPKEYLHQQRGLSVRIIRDLGLGWTEGKISIPHYANGKVANVKFRCLNGGTKYTSLKHATFDYLYPYDYFRVTFNNRVVYLTEGEFDSAVVLQANVPALSIPSGVNDDMLRWLPFLKTFETVNTLFDMDEAGRKATTKLTTHKGKTGKTFEELLYPTKLVTWEWNSEWGKDITDARTRLVPEIIRDYEQFQ